MLGLSGQTGTPKQGETCRMVASHLRHEEHKIGHAAGSTEERHTDQRFTSPRACQFMPGSNLTVARLARFMHNCVESSPRYSLFPKLATISGKRGATRRLTFKAPVSAY